MEGEKTVRQFLIMLVLAGCVGCNKSSQKRRLVEKEVVYHKPDNCVEILKPTTIVKPPADTVKHVTINIFPINNLSISAL
jgi:hypothetical protein